MTKKEKVKQIQQTLDYLIAEGMVVEVAKGQFRLRTEEELNKELENCYNV